MVSRDADGIASLGGVVLDELLRSVPTPAYVYDLDAMAASARALVDAFGHHAHRIAYAIKANSAGRIVRTLAAAGCGVEVVSGAELAVALGCGLSPEEILYSGVAKRATELDAAIGAGERGIAAIQLESVEEVGRVEARAKALGRRVRISIRVNPGVEADTHAHVATGHDAAKFGVALEDLDDAYAAIDRSSHLELIGLSSHVGSQLTNTEEYVAAASVLVRVAKERESKSARHLDFLDFGGGFGVDYGTGCPVRPADFVRAAIALFEREGMHNRRLVIEPGRSLVASHGVLCATVVTTKVSKSGRRWLMIDAGMNDLIRPALYGAHHRIEPTDQTPTSDALPYRVVGPVCESSDDFGEHRFDSPPSRVVIRDAGAYGFTMANEYNGRALPTEVFLRGGKVEHVNRSPGEANWVARRLAT